MAKYDNVNLTKKSRREILSYERELAELGMTSICKEMGEDVLDELQVRWNQYLDIVDRHEMMPQWSSFSLACGVDSQTMNKWVSGAEEWTVKTIRPFLLRLDSFFESSNVDNALMGNVKEVFAIFTMKNLHKWTNEDQKPTQQIMNVQLTPDQLIDTFKSMQLVQKKE